MKFDCMLYNRIVFTNLPMHAASRQPHGTFDVCDNSRVSDQWWRHENALAIWKLNLTFLRFYCFHFGLISESQKISLERLQLNINDKCANSKFVTILYWKIMFLYYYSSYIFLIYADFGRFWYYVYLFWCIVCFKVFWTTRRLRFIKHDKCNSP